MKKILITFIITAIIFTGVGGYAASQYLAKDIIFTPINDSFINDDGKKIDNVEDALNELYAHYKENIVTGDEYAFLIYSNGWYNLSYINGSENGIIDYNNEYESDYFKYKSFNNKYGNIYANKDAKYMIIDRNGSITYKEYKTGDLIISSSTTSSNGYFIIPEKF